MAASSMMLPLATEVPAFTLASTDGGTVSSADLHGRALLVMFLCKHCPYVKHVEDELARLGKEYMDRGVDVVAIASNDAEVSPEDSPEGLAEQKARVGFTFPYLLDTTQDVAKAYGAACTPDFYVFDADHTLVYRGQMDGARPRSDVPVTGADLRAALDAVLDGRPVPEDQVPSMGCSIKWGPGNAPS